LDIKKWDETSRMRLERHRKGEDQAGGPYLRRERKSILGLPSKGGSILPREETCEKEKRGSTLALKRKRGEKTS